eukprot:8313878-Lingulodinium_polyedra.AAC.1
MVPLQTTRGHLGSCGSDPMSAKVCSGCVCGMPCTLCEVMACSWSQTESKASGCPQTHTHAHTDSLFALVSAWLARGYRLPTAVLPMPLLPVAKEPAVCSPGRAMIVRARGWQHDARCSPQLSRAI